MGSFITWKKVQPPQLYLKEKKKKKSQACPTTPQVIRPCTISMFSPFSQAVGHGQGLLASSGGLIQQCGNDTVKPPLPCPQHPAQRLAHSRHLNVRAIERMNERIRKARKSNDISQQLFVFIRVYHLMWSSFFCCINHLRSFFIS